MQFLIGLLLFTYGGMDMAQGLQWNLNTGVMNTYEFEFSWFVGVIIGAVVAALTVTHVPKRYFYVSCRTCIYKKWTPNESPFCSSWEE